MNPLFVETTNNLTLNARQRSEAVKQQIQRKNQVAQQRNEQIGEVLRLATQFDFEANPRRWWQWWQDYVDEKPEQRAVALQRGLSESLLQLPPSSLAAGTPVWTQTGRRPIEQLRVGDLVLAQDLDTGELAYKAVRGISSAVAPTRRVEVQDTAFLCAPGLSLWQADKGWWLARDLETKSLMHGLFGPVPVTRNAESIAGPTYHLAVADFSNFFISDEAILVHDATQTTPVALRVPGLPASADTGK